jgi:hypothetical protein
MLVNSSDGFDDCWEPFFRLLKIYWPKFNAKILLNTEAKEWGCSDFEVECTKVGIGEKKKLTWSECLIKALNKIETPLVLYFQEDYFLNKNTNVDLINNCAEYMLKNPQIKHISLTRHGSLGPHEPYHEEWLEKISQSAKYRVSTQAGLWNVDALKSYLKKNENGWMFEIYGTWRAHRSSDIFLVAKCIHNEAAIEYTHTGIIKGKWHPDIPEIFKRHGIKINFAKRGFYKKKNFFINKFELQKKIALNPFYFISQASKMIIFRIRSAL